MLALGQSIVVVMGGIVLGRHVGSRMVAGELFDGFHTGSTTVADLHEVEVTGGLDGDTHLDTVANLQGCSLSFLTSLDQFTLHGDATLRGLHLGSLLQELSIDSTP